MLDQPKKILIIRLSAIGDIVMASPLIKILRSRYPDSSISWLVQSESMELLTANPLLDEVIVWPRSDWHKLWADRSWIRLMREVHLFISGLRARRFDTVIDLQGLFKSGIWARLSGAPVRIGLGSKEGSSRLMTQIVNKPINDKLIGSEYRHLAQVLGCDPGTFEMDVALSDADEHFAAQLIQQHNLTKGYVVICPFTTRPQKHWVAGNWPLLADRLRVEHGINTIILGGSENREAAEAMVKIHHDSMINMSGNTSLRQAAAIISQSQLIVGVDTGLTHMGIAFNVPTIAIFGSTCPYLQTGRDNTKVIYKQLECSPCKRNPTCHGAYTCMTSVTVDDVITNVHRLL